MAWLNRIFNKLKQDKNNKKDFALKIQAELLVLRSIVMRSSLLMLSKDPDLIKSVKYSCLNEIQSLELLGANKEEQEKFIEFAETALEDMFSRVRIDNKSLETLN
ncbi:MAG: hypothetical protein JW812_01150 [Alphaproteobacteria bacterium]|nr:hypothetical protein [Alphaproteobacteria bacterium]MBN2779659.1 hypothetical protein [Alphaproteobacteria bacterium]